MQVNAGAGRYGDWVHSAETGPSRFKPLESSGRCNWNQKRAERSVFLPVPLGVGRPPPSRPLIRQLRSPSGEGRRQDHSHHLRNRRRLISTPPGSEESNPTLRFRPENQPQLGVKHEGAQTFTGLASSPGCLPPITAQWGTMAQRGEKESGGREVNELRNTDYNQAPAR